MFIVYYLLYYYIILNYVLEYKNYITIRTHLQKQKLLVYEVFLSYYDFLGNVRLICDATSHW